MEAQINSTNVETSETTESTQAPPQTPEEIIKALENAAEECKRNIEAQKAFCENLTKDLQTIQQAKGDLDKSLEDYEKGVEGYQERKKICDEYYAKKKEMIEAAIKDKKEKIEEIIKNYDEKIKTAKEKMDTAESDLSSAEAAYEQAEKENEAAQQAYDAAKKILEEIGNKLQELEALRELIEEEDAKCHTASMYFLILGYKQILDEIKIQSLKEYEEHLIQLWRDLNTKKATLRDKQKELNEKKEKYELCKQPYEALVQNRKEALLEELQELETASSSN
jgi:chromosome segregation ATPase